MIRALWRSRITLACCALIVGACGARTSLEIRAQLDGTPLENLHITALPFDPDDLLDSLAAASPTPRPDMIRSGDCSSATSRRSCGIFDPQMTPRRNGLLAPGWRSGTRSRDWPIPSTRQTDVRQTIPRRTSDSAPCTAAFRSGLPNVTQRSGASTVPTCSLHGARRQQPIRSVPGNTTHYPDVARQKVERLGRPAMETTTDSSGVAELALASGAWWIVARWPDPGDPFMEYYWNVPVHVNGWLPAAVPLHRTTAVRRWRH